MKKTIFKSALLAITSVGLLAGGAFAAPWDSLPAQWQVSTAMDLWTYTDLTTANSDFLIVAENAAYESKFGLYSLDAGGNLDDMFQVFGKGSGSEPGAERILAFQEVAGVTQVKKTDGVGTLITDWTDFSSSFGFYYEVFANDNYLHTFYLDSSFNTVDAGTEHITTAYDAGIKRAFVYLEDLALSAPPDWDWNDMTVRINDVKPVPEPTTMLLFGTGLAGLVCLRRKKGQK